MAEPEEIYEFIAQQGTLSVLPGQRQGLPCHPGFFDLSGDPAARLSSLLATFAVEDLVKARVAQLDDQGNATLIPHLAKDSSWVLALRRKANAEPFDLLVNGRGLAGRHFPWRSVLADYRVPTMMDNFGGQLLIAMSPADMAALWTLGMPATSAEWLKDIGGKPLDSLCKALGLSRTPAADGRILGTAASVFSAQDQMKQDGIPLVLANWSPSTLDRMPIPAVAEIVEHFRKLYAFLGLAVDDFGVWNPSPEDVECFKFCIRFGDPGELSNVFLERFEASCESIIETAGGVQQAPATVAEAAATWLSALASRTDEHRRKVAWDNVKKLQEIELVEPLLKLGREAPDPVRRSLINTLAGINPGAPSSGTCHSIKVHGWGGRAWDEWRRRAGTRGVAAASCANGSDHCAHPGTSTMQAEEQNQMEHTESSEAAQYFRQELGLAPEEIAEVARQGFISHEVRNKSTVYKLRYRRRGRQRVRYLGTDSVRVQAVQRALVNLQRRRKSELELRTLSRQAAELLRDSKRRLEPLLKTAGLRFHGRAIRRPRASSKIARNNT
jgi:hypothetical protein